VADHSSDGGAVTPRRRLRPRLPAELDDAQRALYDELISGPRATDPRHFPLVAADGGLEGPFDAFLLQPLLGERLQALGAAIRFRTGLTDRCREIAILTVAWAWRSAFEWYAHERIGTSVGITDRELDAIRAGRAADTARNWPDAVERTTLLVARSLVEVGDLDDGLYADAVALLGEVQLFELVTLVGYYASLAMQLRVFRVPAPDGDVARATGPGAATHSGHDKETGT
jgi:4-carboxymuconolactone decarboxylase